MATDLTREEMRRLARLGAERRLEELRREEASIRAAFPDISGAAGTSRRGQARAQTPAASGNEEAGSKQSRRRPRRKMSAAEKRAVSERMRKYWAARRKANG